MESQPSKNRTYDTKKPLTISILTQTGLGNALSDFLIDRDVSGVRPATLEFYRREIGLFMRWASEAGARELSDVSPDLLRAYFLSLRERRKQSATHTNYTALRTWLLWCWVDYDMPGVCPISKVKVAGGEAKIMPAIGLEDFGRMLTACTGEHQKRDKAILLFLLDTGIRRAELVRLKVAALRAEGVVQLEADGAKTGEARKVFLSRETQRALKSYLAERGSLPEDAPLFAASTGTAFTPSGLRQVVRRLCSRAGLPEAGMHSFRRGFALESLRAGADLLSVSRLLGHRQLTTTKRYLPLTDDDLRQVHARTSPVNQLRKRNG